MAWMPDSPHKRHRGNGKWHGVQKNDRNGIEQPTRTNARQNGKNNGQHVKGKKYTRASKIKQQEHKTPTRKPKINREEKTKQTKRVIEYSVDNYSYDETYIMYNYRIGGTGQIEI